jgi:hypothetical protein
MVDEPSRSTRGGVSWRIFDMGRASAMACTKLGASAVAPTGDSLRGRILRPTAFGCAFKKSSRWTFSIGAPSSFRR